MTCYAEARSFLCKRIAGSKEADGRSKWTSEEDVRKEGRKAGMSFSEKNGVKIGPWNLTSLFLHWGHSSVDWESSTDENIALVPYFLSCISLLLNSGITMRISNMSSKMDKVHFLQLSVLSPPLCYHSMYSDKTWQSWHAHSMTAHLTEREPS